MTMCFVAKRNILQQNSDRKLKQVKKSRAFNETPSQYVGISAILNFNIKSLTVVAIPSAKLGGL